MTTSRKRTITFNLGTPVLGVLGLILCSAKAFGFATYSWWWATAPFWVPFVVLVAFLGLFFVFWMLLEVPR